MEKTGLKNWVEIIWNGIEIRGFFAGGLFVAEGKAGEAVEMMTVAEEGEIKIGGDGEEETVVDYHFLVYSTIHRVRM